MGWEQVFFQLKSVSCCPLECCPSGSHHVVERGWLPSLCPGSSCTDVHPCSWGLKLCCQNLGLQGRVPIEGHQVITRQEHRRTVASFDLQDAPLLAFMSPSGLGHARIQAQCCRAPLKPNSGATNHSQFAQAKRHAAADRSPAANQLARLFEGTGSHHTILRR